MRIPKPSTSRAMVTRIKGRRERPGGDSALGGTGVGEASGVASLGGLEVGAGMREASVYGWFGSHPTAIAGQSNAEKAVERREDAEREGIFVHRVPRRDPPALS